MTEDKKYAGEIKDEKGKTWKICEPVCAYCGQTIVGGMDTDIVLQHWANDCGKNQFRKVK